MRSIVFACAALFAASQAHAVTTSYTLDATPTAGSASIVSSFLIDFDDSDMNGLLSNVAEATSFSGIDFMISGVTAPRDTLVAVPTIPGISSGPGHATLGDQFWVFSDGVATTSVQTISFTYVLTEHTPSEVPVPASGLLLLGALGGVGSMRRRRRG